MSSLTRSADSLEEAESLVRDMPIIESVRVYEAHSHVAAASPARSGPCARTGTRRPPHHCCSAVWRIGRAEQAEEAVMHGVGGFLDG